MFLTAKDGRDLPEEKVKVWLLQKWTKIPMRYLFTTVQYYLDKDEWKIDYNELDGISWLHLSCLMFAVSGQAERYLYSLILPPPATLLPHFYNLACFSNNWRKRIPLQLPQYTNSPSMHKVRQFCLKIVNNIIYVWM